MMVLAKGWSWTKVIGSAFVGEAICTFSLSLAWSIYTFLCVSEETEKDTVTVCEKLTI